MDLDIGEEAERLARELARRTGESVPQAVTTALQERLERVDAPHEAAGDDELGRKIDDFAARFRKALQAEGLTVDQIMSDDWLYDEHGLPR